MVGKPGTKAPFIRPAVRVGCSPNNLAWQRNVLAAYIKVGDTSALTEGYRNRALESYKTALARAQELAAKYPNNSFFAAQPELVRKKMEQLATEPRQ